jgi:hypothetical protein
VWFNGCGHMLCNVDYVFSVENNMVRWPGVFTDGFLLAADFLLYGHLLRQYMYRSSMWRYEGEFVLNDKEILWDVGGDLFVGV